MESRFSGEEGARPWLQSPAPQREEDGGKERERETQREAEGEKDRKTGRGTERGPLLKTERNV